MNPPETKNHFNAKLLSDYLEGHPEQDIHVECVTEGYPLYLEDRTTENLSKKVANVIRNKRDLHAMLRRMLKEAKKGYIKKGTGHYQLNLLCVPKKDNETQKYTEIRVARHGSYSTEYTVSINSKISREESAIPTLPNIRIYIQLLILFNYVSIRDLKDAFRQLFVAKPDVGYIQYCIFGMQWVDLKVAYGISSAASICQRFAELLIWVLDNKILNENQRNRIIVHIDDFLIGGTSEQEANDLANKFDNLCDQLNVNVSHEKDENGIQKGIVHGFGFNLNANPKYVFIPRFKFWEIFNGIVLICKYRYARGDVLESVCGKCMHWSQFRKKAKMLCHRIMGLILQKIRANKKLQYKIFFVPYPIVKDLLFWAKYMLAMYRIPMASIIYQPSVTISASTDASSFAGGYVLGGNWCSYDFSTQENKYGLKHSKMSINYQEAHAIIMMLWHHRKSLSGRKVLLYVDNQSVMYSLYKCWSGSTTLMEFIQEIVLIMCIYCIDIHVEYIPTSINKCSDSLSRKALDLFHRDVELYGMEVNDIMDDPEYYEELRLLKGSEVPQIDKNALKKLFGN